ncbi:MAG TPA: hypothetical protein DCZ94_21505 [Lentisphaeria bacterium]|nr:MAG: hypothetical protein A2X48_14435 [Lentisphaerae bacterium GWF2_49_21]HBC89522.1 hypothetical protein [Lentisphaeria bacterium]
MPFVIQYGNPYAADVGGQIFDSAMREKSFARRMENARINIAARQLDLEQSRQVIQMNQADVEANYRNKVLEQKEKSDAAEMQFRAGKEMQDQQNFNRRQSLDEKQFGFQETKEKNDEAARVQKTNQLADQWANEVATSGGKVFEARDAQEWNEYVALDKRIREAGAAPSQEDGELYDKYQAKFKDISPDHVSVRFGDKWGMVPSETAQKLKEYEGKQKIEAEIKTKYPEKDTQTHYDFRKMLDINNENFTLQQKRLDKLASDGYTAKSPEYREAQKAIESAQKKKDAMIQFYNKPAEGAVYSEVYGNNHAVIDSTPALKEKMNEAAKILKDKSSTQEEISKAMDIINDVAAKAEALKTKGGLPLPGGSPAPSGPKKTANDYLK